MRLSYGRRDVAYRTIARPLVTALRNSALRAQIEIVRPGTFAALTDHLDRARAQYGDGHYHLIHFDMHGTLAEAAGGALDDGSRLLYDQSGAGGARDHAFLAFDGAEPGQPHLVSAGEVADLLKSHQIPIAVLNACQSAKQKTTAVETSLGSHLMLAGVQLVLAMGYSVTVSAAQKLMATLYEQLLAGRPLGQAIRQGRRALYQDKERRAHHNFTIPLEDWLLPVVYQNREVTVKTTDFASVEAENAFFQRQAARYRAPRLAYGFVGRDVDILEIERLLLAESNILLVRGMGGAGKTALLHHLGDRKMRRRSSQQVFITNWGWWRRHSGSGRRPLITTCKPSKSMHPTRIITSALRYAV